MKCSMRCGRTPPQGYKTCETCRARVARYTEANRAEINTFKRYMVRIGAWKEKQR